MQKWDYLHLQQQAERVDKLSQEIASAGLEGWELVSVVSVETSPLTRYVHAYLKKPRST